MYDEHFYDKVVYHSDLIIFIAYKIKNEAYENVLKSITS